MFSLPSSKADLNRFKFGTIDKSYFFWGKARVKIFSDFPREASFSYKPVWRGRTYTRFHSFLISLVHSQEIYQASFDHVKVGPMPVLALHNLWCQIYMFLDIFKWREENKTKTIVKKLPKLSVKLLWKK